jgi:hypothetical protein
MAAGRAPILGVNPHNFSMIFTKNTNYILKNNLNYKSSLNIKIRYNIVNLSYIAFIKNK